MSMLWYITGAKHNPEKRKQNAEEKAAQSKEYENKWCKRQTQSQWSIGRAWLRIETDDNDKETMFCDFCIKAKIPGDNSAFIHGCTNLKLETIKKHEGSNNHLLAANKHANEKEPTKAPAFMAKMSLNKAIYTKLSILFRNVHAINIQGRPARDF